MFYNCTLIAWEMEGGKGKIPGLRSACKVLSQNNNHIYYSTNGMVIDLIKMGSFYSWNVEDLCIFLTDLIFVGASFKTCCLFFPFISKILSCFVILGFFETVSLCLPGCPRASSLCRPSCHRANRDLPTSASWVLGFKTGTTIPSLISKMLLLNYLAKTTQPGKQD